MYCLEHVFFSEKRYATLLERQFKLSGLMQYYPWVLKDVNVLLVTTCLHISHLLAPHDLREPFFFSRRATMALTRISFKLLGLLLTISIIYLSVYLSIYLYIYIYISSYIYICRLYIVLIR